jgi:Fe-S oxidoreductase
VQLWITIYYNLLIEKETQTEEYKADAIVSLFMSLDPEERSKTWSLIKLSLGYGKKRRVTYKDGSKKNTAEKFKKTGSYAETAREISEELGFDVNEANVRRWADEYLTEDELKHVTKQTKLSRKRSEKYPEMEKKLAAWFKTKRASKNSVSMKMIRDEAKKIFKELKDQYQQSQDEN